MTTIITKELKELWRDGRIKYAGIILILLLAIASFIGFDQYQRTNAEYQQARDTERTMWESQEDKNPHSAAHYGTYAFKPKFALSLVDNGVNSYTGNSIFLEAHRRHEAAYSDASDQSELSRFGSLSISFILMHLVPLLIFLLGYNAFTKERELDTLRLLKSQGVKPIRLILGKWLSIFTPVFILTTVLFAIIGALLSSLASYANFEWQSLGLMWISYLLYYMIITSLVLLISRYSKTSGIALVTCLFMWILFGFIAPKISSNVANSLHPYPNMQTFNARIQADKEKGLDGHNPWNEEAQKLKERTLKEYGVDSVEQLPFNYDGYRMQKGEEHEAATLKKHHDKLNAISRKQNASYQAMATISPFIPLRLLSMNIANTGYHAHWNFSEAAEQYRIEKQRYLNNDFKDNSKTGDWGYKMTSEGFKKLPAFNYSPLTYDDIVKENTRNYVILLLWLIVPSLLLLISSKKL